MPRTPGTPCTPRMAVTTCPSGTITLAGPTPYPHYGTDGTVGTTPDAVGHPSHMVMPVPINVVLRVPYKMPFANEFVP